jgi:hypothetical protein
MMDKSKNKTKDIENEAEESHEFHNDYDPDKVSSNSKVKTKGTKVDIPNLNDSDASDTDGSDDSFGAQQN